MTYDLQHALSVVIWIVGIAAGALASAYLLPAHPSWLSGDVAATAAIVSTICIAIQGGLPQVQRTPSKREDSYVKAAVSGELPKDIAVKHPLIRVDPAKPLDTI